LVRKCVNTTYGPQCNHKTGHKFEFEIKHLSVHIRAKVNVLRLPKNAISWHLNPSFCYDGHETSVP
jgi:hypothetical protein